MKIAIVGTGYVGLVTGTCLAEMGNNVTCVDIDAGKIARLKDGILPIHEPGLEPVVHNNYAAGRLRFTTRLADAADALVWFIAVGTPPGEDGSADLQYVLAVARDIGRTLKDYAVIVDKSTVPVGTAEKVRATVQAELEQRGAAIPFDVVSNPEFLKEGAAVADFMRPDRIVVGYDTERARDIMGELYAPYIRNHDRMIFMGVREAEMTKYAANAMLATKISFINEIASLCDAMDVDVEMVRKGIGSDARIGYSFIYPGCGYGGSCFPKDVRALVRMAEDHEIVPGILHAVEARNESQKRVLFGKITERFGKDLSGLTFALWGLAFKPETDDMREASSVVLIRQLLEAGAQVRAYDPVAMPTAERELPRLWFESARLSLSRNQYEAAEGADALVLVTEWRPFRLPDFDLLKRTLRQPVIFDGRNQYNPRQLEEAGFYYRGIGRR